MQEEFLGEESLGEKYMGEVCVGEKYVGEKYVCESFFPRASERRVLLIVGVCQTFSHFHIF